MRLLTKGSAQLPPRPVLVVSSGRRGQTLCCFTVKASRRLRDRQHAVPDTLTTIRPSGCSADDVMRFHRVATSKATIRDCLKSAYSVLGTTVLKARSKGLCYDAPTCKGSQTLLCIQSARSDEACAANWAAFVLARMGCAALATTYS
jgi:hypothetical protein